jgi:hypothetical protein
MGRFLQFLKEEAEGDGKLKHITHPEDRPLMHGAKGFKRAVEVLNKAHNHIKSGGHSSDMTMKYDGSPSLVFGHHPETGKFFVASKSAFNKNPKINYTSADIQKNHGHAPGLVDKLQASLTHLKKVAPKKGVYQGDVMFSHGDVKHKSGGKASFTPNTITYTAKGDEAEKVKKAKLGIVVHQQYHGDTLDNMKADPHPDHHNFGHHPDVWHKSAELNTKNVHYSEEDQNEFHKHMEAAKKIHDAHGKEMYKATEPHSGEAGHLATYINHTVRTDEKPTPEGLKKHIADKYKKSIEKLKTPAAQSKKASELKSHMDYIDANKKHYKAALDMHQHLEKAKNVLVRTLNQAPGGLEHHINDKPTDPEGYVVNHAGEPDKLVNRKEFAKANLLKVRK